MKNLYAMNQSELIVVAEELGLSNVHTMTNFTIRGLIIAAQKVVVQKQVATNMFVNILKGISIIPCKEDVAECDYVNACEDYGYPVEEMDEDYGVKPVVEVTTKKQISYFKFLCHKYCISVKVPDTSKESRIKITAILKGIKSGRVQERYTTYTGRDAECLVGAMDQR